MTRSLVLLIALTLVPLAAKELKVDRAEEIIAALAVAQPGDVILIKPGVYQLPANLKATHHGTAERPITMRCAGRRGYAVLAFASGQIGYRVDRCYWRFEGIHFKGDPGRTSATVFMDGPAGLHHVHFRDCRISHARWFGMKAGRDGGDDKAVHDVLIERTELFATGGTGFDLVCGDRWTLRGCYVHDYGRRGGISYGIFLKGGGRDGVVEGCLVDGTNPHGTTVGISFGGGTTGSVHMPRRDGRIAPEHQRGVARNNIVVDTTDVAFHTNAADGCAFVHNLAWRCADVQRQSARGVDPVVVNNLIAGSTADGTSRSEGNRAPQADWFEDPDDNDFRLTDAGVEALAEAGAALDLELCPRDRSGTKRKADAPVIGPMLPGARRSTAWRDPRR